MECVSLNSRLISSATYYRGAKKLRVWFHSGRYAIHDNVTAGVFDNLVNADSPGFYYKNYIAGRDWSQIKKSNYLLKVSASVVLAAALVMASGLYSPKTFEQTAFASSAD